MTDLYGVGPVIAALLIGHTGDITRFPSSRGTTPPTNGTAPIEASSGPKVRHRLNPRGNRQLNHALHMIAVTQIRGDNPGRDYYRKKIAEGKTTREARRALKRKISDAGLPPAPRRHPELSESWEGNQGTTLTPARPAPHPDSRLFG